METSIFFAALKQSQLYLKVSHQRLFELSDSTTRVRAITVEARNHMKMNVENGLSCRFTVIDTKVVAGRLQRQDRILNFQAVS